MEECKDYRLLSCDSCGAEYHRELRSRYFSCYCTIKTKSAEREVYDFLKTLYPRVSREEHYPGSRHKADLKVVWETSLSSSKSTVVPTIPQCSVKTTGDTKNPSWNTEVGRISCYVCVKPRWWMGGVILEAYFGGISEETPQFHVLEK
jgi:hypothetical protein